MSLIASTKVNDLQALETLIAEGVNVDAVDELGRTALRWAADMGHAECATALIDAKADVDMANRGGITALHIASINGRAECVRILIQHKANVNALRIGGSSPLHCASMKGHLACVQILVAAGAERDRPVGHTPLAYAIMGNHLNVAECLLHSGAKVKNLTPRVKIPAWMADIIAKRQNAIASLRVMKGVWRRRFKVPGSGNNHIANRVPLDVVSLLGLYVWSTRLDPSWGNELDGQGA